MRRANRKGGGARIGHGGRRPLGTPERREPVERPGLTADLRISAPGRRGYRAVTFPLPNGRTGERACSRARRSRPFSHLVRRGLLLITDG